MTISHSDQAREALGNPDLPEIINLDGASALTSMPKGTLRYLRSKGEGPKSFLLGGRVRYRRAEVLAWIAAQEQATSRGGAA